MINLKRTILLFFAFCLLSFQQDKIKRIIIVAYREPEMMYGNVKEVIENRPPISGLQDKPKLPANDTTVFNKKGDPIETWIFNKNDPNASPITYHTDYDARGTRLKTTINIDKGQFFKCDNKGQPVLFEDYAYSISRFQPISSETYKYDALGRIIESNFCYFGNESTPLRIEYEYNADGLLSESYYYGHHDSVNFKNRYKYISLDKNGNWTKRVVIHWNDIRPYETETVERKITYY